MLKLRWIVVVLSLALGLYGVIATTDGLNFARAQFQAIETLEKSGIAPERIDGGAVHSIHRLKHPLFGASVRQSIGWPERVRGAKERAKLRWWPIIREDYIIATCTLENYHPIKEIKYWSPLAFKWRKILILESDQVLSKPTG